MKPFLKWAGGKRRVADVIRPFFPKSKYKRMVVPFAGAGGVFIGTNYSRYLIADINPDLINLYQILALIGDSFIEYAATFFCKESNMPDYYYDLRATFNRRNSTATSMAAMFLYLNRHGFNGLCRYNLKKGGYNVPFGKYEKPYFPEEEMRDFVRWSNARQVIFKCADFRGIMKEVAQEDFVYCDPPYLPLKDGGFTSYHGKFGEQEHRALDAWGHTLINDLSVPTFISSHDTEKSRHIYCNNTDLYAYSASRTINRDGDNRNKTGEVLFIYN